MKKRRVKRWKTEKERQMILTKWKKGRGNRKDKVSRNQIENTAIENGLKGEGG